MANQNKTITPEQIKAARALLRLEQEELAKRAGVSVTTVRRMEAPGGATQVAPQTFRHVSGVLEEAGAEFIHEGVARKPVKRSEEERRQRMAELNEIVERFTALHKAQGGRFLTDDDLYDEFGLPK